MTKNIHSRTELIDQEVSSGVAMQHWPYNKMFSEI